MALTETHDYDDIINLPHHQSRRHAHMALSGRAAQLTTTKGCLARLLAACRACATSSLPVPVSPWM